MKRRLFGIVLLIAGAAAIFFVPWASLASNLSNYTDLANDERPAWIVADGRLYPVKLYPELFGVIGRRFGGDGKSTFAVGKREQEPDYFANDRFGSRLVFRCVATRKLEDNTPVGTLAWCDRAN